MTAPSVTDVIMLARQLQDLVAQVTSEYRWTYGMAFSGRVGESVKVRLQAISPTEAVAASNPSFHLEQVHERMLDVKAELMGAHARLLRVQDAYDPPRRDLIEHRKLATRMQVQDSREAQQRRKERDEHIPA